MAGHLVFQHHFELNFTINRHSTEFNLANAGSIHNKSDSAEVDIFIQEGRYEEAQSLLLDQIEKDTLNYKANEKLIL